MSLRTRKFKYQSEQCNVENEAVLPTTRASGIEIVFRGADVNARKVKV